MNYLPLAVQIFRPFLVYDSSNQHSAFAKDPSKRLAVALWAAMRFHTLNINELSALHPYFPINTWHIYTLSLSVPIASSILSSYSKEFLRRSSGEASRNFPACLRVFLTTLCQSIEKVDAQLTSAYSYSDVVLNTAFCISYVAMISLGMPIGGTLGLASLALLALKRYRHLPEWLQPITAVCDRSMGPLIILAGIGILCTNQLTLLDYFSVFEKATALFSYAINTQTLRELLPDWANNPRPSAHIKPEVPWKQFLKLLKAFPQNPQPAVLEMLYEINPTYIWAEQVGNVFPESVNDKTAKVLFQELETKMADSVHLNDLQKEGLEKIKEAAIHGRVGDLIPVNVSEFQKLIRAYVQSILDDPEFAQKIIELAALGNSCAEGWTRDVNYLLNPRSKDIIWLIHFQLSKLRGEMIKEVIQKIPMKSITRDWVGGTQNIHFTQSVESALWIYFRSYEAELARKLNPPNVLEASFIHCVPDFHSRYHKNSFITFLTIMYISLKLGSKNTPFFPLENIEKIFNQFSCCEIVVERIYDSIKPQYIMVEGHIEARREIPWELVSDHLIKQKNNLDLAKNWFNLVETDEYGHSYPSRQGVCALLLDMGIISLKT